MCDVVGESVISDKAPLPDSRYDLTRAASDETVRSKTSRESGDVFVDPGRQQLRGGGPECRRILCHDGYRRCQHIHEGELVEAGQRDRPAPYPSEWAGDGP